MTATKLTISIKLLPSLKTLLNTYTEILKIWKTSHINQNTFLQTELLCCVGNNCM